MAGQAFRDRGFAREGITEDGMKTAAWKQSGKSGGTPAGQLYGVRS